MPALSSHPLPPLQFPDRSRGIRVTPVAPEAAPKSSPRPTPTPRTPPLLAGRYTIDRYLDKGGTSRVYLGWDELCEDDIVIKVLTDEAANCSVLRGHFLVGSRAALSIQHQNVVRVLAVREPEVGSPYMVMEVLRGELLADLLDRTPQLSPRATLALAAQAASGLVALHAAGIVHCDIKPENLYLSSAPGSGKTLKILDFGLAEVEGQSATNDPPAVRGTAQYMAPEQVLGDPVDERTDVYALGVVMFRMLTGQLPFDLKLSTTLLRHQLISPAPPPSWLCEALDPSVEAIVLKAMRKNPANRYGSAAELLTELGRVSNGGSVPLVTETAERDVYTPRSRHGEKAAEILGVR
ncbi:MAG TPA: serine/threonine-protein kinase [Polyangiaceae bacterium]|jgi:serine/threonine protein kinase|nr:serine/threonine-protein kinase [Polyangiaceae bacterium]